MAETPIYVGNGKKHGKFENCLSFGFSAEHLSILGKNLNEKGWVNVLISPQRGDATKYYAKLDTYIAKNDERREERQEQERQGFQPNDKLDAMGRSDQGGDLPF